MWCVGGPAGRHNPRDGKQTSAGGTSC